MEKKLFDSPTGMPLDPSPLVYLHEHFKANNNMSSSPLKNNWVWFETEDLRTIIKMIEQIDVDGKKINGDGVRLYYGIYDEKVCEFLTKVSRKKDPKNYRDYSDHLGHNTVFFVPTYKGAHEDEHIDCITKESAAEKKKDYEKGKDLPEPFTGGFDVGHICPPPPSPGGSCTSSGSNL